MTGYNPTTQSKDKCVVIHVGNQGIRQAAPFWRNLAIECGIDIASGKRDPENLMEIDHPTMLWAECANGRFQARAVFLDDGTKSYDELNNAPIANLFDPNAIPLPWSSQNGSFHNYARSCTMSRQALHHHMEHVIASNSAFDGLRKFIFIHSCTGGIKFIIIFIRVVVM